MAMQSDIQDLLNDWGLSTLIQTFEENMIDIEALKLLCEEDVRQLVKPLGLMVKFREHWKKWMESLTDKNDSNISRATTPKLNQNPNESLENISYTTDLTTLSEFSYDLTTSTPSTSKSFVTEQTREVKTPTIEFSLDDVGEILSSENAVLLDKLVAFDADYLTDDFERTYPDKVHQLNNAVVLLKEKIVKIAQEKVGNSRNKDLKTEIQNLLEIISGSVGEDSQLATLLLLPYILAPPSNTRSKDKSSYKPSRVEVKEAFIVLIPTEAEILSTIGSKKIQCETNGRTFQPLVILVGNCKSVTKSVVVVNDTIYELNSCMEAEDTAFKIFHATGACYPDEAYHIWLVIQLALYNITTKFDRISQSIRYFLTNIGHINF